MVKKNRTSIKLMLKQGLRAEHAWENIIVYRHHHHLCIIFLKLGGAVAFDATIK